MIPFLKSLFVKALFFFLKLRQFGVKLQCYMHILCHFTSKCC